MNAPDENLANENCGWASVLPILVAASRDEVVNALVAYVRDASPNQIRAWRSSVKNLQQQGRMLVEPHNAAGGRYGAVLEYLMPDGGQRADAVLLLSGAVLVLEFKGDAAFDPAALEQVSDYARRLAWYHVSCQPEQVRVHAVVIAYGQRIVQRSTTWHTVTDVAQFSEVVRAFDRPEAGQSPSIEGFISSESNQPSCSLVEAARRFFAKHSLPHVKRIDDLTQGAVERILQLVRSTHAQGGRTLVLLSGVPGAGKTYIGLRIAHESGLDELSEPKPLSGQKPPTPAVFLSGNAPLVEVLQFELRRAGGDGRVFVRNVREFIERFTKQRNSAPPHHVLIFDEAQRAWDESRMQKCHDRHAVSEPLTFLRLAQRVPKWSVVLAILGSGQEIHEGEEGGIELWAEAVRHAGEAWEVAGPASLRGAFEITDASYSSFDELHLATSVRFQFAAELSAWVSELIVNDARLPVLATLAAKLTQRGYQLRVTRDLECAKQFLWDKYAHQPEARFGMLVSSRDKALGSFGVAAADMPSFRPGPWYTDQDSPNSCRRLLDAISEFKAQGLELDHTLLVWGTDFVLRNGAWDISAARRYAKKSGVRNGERLRRNAYRVLLTRGREGMILCLPAVLTELDETYAFLVAAGCEELAAR